MLKLVNGEKEEIDILQSFQDVVLLIIFSSPGRGQDAGQKGRRRERGEDAAAARASWTYYEYMKELLLAIIYHNTEADASHLLTVEM